MPSLSGVRHFATYAAEPQKWQSDEDVRQYAKFLAVEEKEPDAFIAAAVQLRSRADLPADLRASAGRSQARVLFRRAVKCYEALSINPRKSWPSEAYEEAVQASTRAYDLYTAVLDESKDQALIAELAEITQDWEAAVAATSAAYVEVRKLRATLCLLRARWLLAQVEQARAVAHAERSGASSAAFESAERLRSAGLPDAKEDELLHEVVGAADRIAELCASDSHVPTSEDLQKLRIQGQTLLIVNLKDLALACACNHRIEEAAQHMIRALSIRLDGGKPLPADIKEQVGMVAQAVWEHCTKNLKSAATTEQAEAAMRLSTTLGSSLMSFNAQSSS